MKSTLTKISAIKRNPNNPRILKDDKFAKLTQSIKDFPQMLDIRPIVVNDDMVVLGGNMRLKACKEAGLKDVPVIKVSDLSEEQQREFIIKDNVGFGEWDWDLLANEWDTDLLDDWGLELDFDPADDDGLTDDEDTPEVTDNPISNVGDVWLLGEHRLMCGDSTNSNDVSLLMNGATADMVFTDPPYGMSYGGGRTDKFDMIKGDDVDPTVFYHAIPDAREVYVWGRVQNYQHIKPDPRDVIVWKKNNFGLGKGYRGQYEVCFYWGGFSGSDSDVWEVAKDTDYVHPTQKPVELCLRAIKNSQPKNILDLYSGSGSTLIACEKRDVPFMGMEFDPKYVDVIIKRWQDYTGKKAVHAESGEEFTKLDTIKE